MEFKKSIIILIMAIFLISIAGVCASDANDAATNAENNIGVDFEVDGSDIANSSAQKDSAMGAALNSDSGKSEMGNYEFNHDSRIEEGEIPKNEDYELIVDALVDGDSVDITVDLPMDASAQALIDVDGVGYYANVTGGAAKLHLDDLPKGNHEVVAKYVGDANYGQRSNITSFVVFNTTLSVQAIAVNVTSGQNALFVIDTIDDFNGNVSIKVEDKLLYNGSVKLLIVADKLTGGDKTAVMVFYGDKRYDKLTLDNVRFSVAKSETQISAEDVVATYNTNENLVVTLKDCEGNALAGQTITVNLNGAKTYITDANGRIEVPVKGLVPKKYDAEISFSGNDGYEKSARDVKVTVMKATPKLAAAKKTFKKSVKTKKYTATLKDNLGNAINKAKVTLKIKGKKAITAKTNAKGKVTFKIKSLTKKGKYNAVVTYKGNNCYNKATKVVKIIVR